MNIIVCLSNNNGIKFNNRRLSRDKEVIKEIVRNFGIQNIYLRKYSQELFNEYENVNILDYNFNLNNLSEKAYFFCEEELDLNNININKIIMFNWNRDYPADTYFRFNEENFNLVIEKEFVGNSHDKVTEKIFERK